MLPSVRGGALTRDPLFTPADGPKATSSAEHHVSLVSSLHSSAGPLTAPSGHRGQDHQDAPAGEGGDWRAPPQHARRLPWATGAQVRNKDAWPRSLDAGPRSLDAGLQTLFPIGHVSCWVVAKLPALCACCPPMASLVGWGASAHAPPRQLRSRWCAGDENPCGNKAWRRIAAMIRALLGSTTLLPGGWRLSALARRGRWLPF